MPIDFTLTSYQRRLQRMAREFANEILDPLVREADEDPDPQKAFRAVKGAYVESYKLGFATGFIPKKYGAAVSPTSIFRSWSRRYARSILALPPSFSSMDWP